MTIDYSFYPVLKGSLKHRHITTFEEQEILYAFENIEKYIPTKQLELDLSVWLVSMIILRNLNNNYLTRKFVANYGKLFESIFIKDFKNKEVRMEIIEYFISIKKDIKFMPIPDGNKRQELVSIHVMDYLELLEKGLSVQAPQYNLVNQILSKGNVYIETPRFIYLLRLSLEQRLFTKIKSMKEYEENEVIDRCVQQLDEKYPRYDKQRAPSQQNIPYSIQEIIDKARRDHQLDHRSRIKLGIYLQSNGFEDEFIMDIFRQLSDFSEAITRYQLKSLRRYIR